MKETIIREKIGILAMDVWYLVLVGTPHIEGPDS